MVATVGLAGCEKDCRDLKRKLTLLGIHLAGSILGGVVLGLTLGWLGGLARLDGHSWMVAIVTAAACAAYAMNGFRLARLPQPSTGRQVPISWRRLPPPAMAFVYGAPLGAGVFTRIFDGTLYAVVIGIVLIGDALVGAAILGAFGLGRGALVFVVAGVGLRERADVTSLVNGVASLRQQARTAAGVLLGVAAGFLLVVAFSGTIVVPVG